MATVTPLVFRQFRWQALPTRTRIDVMLAFAERRGIGQGAALSAIDGALKNVESQDWALLDEIIAERFTALQRHIVEAATVLFEGLAATLQQIAAGFNAAAASVPAPAGHGTLAAGGVEAGTAATLGTSRTRPASPA